MATPLEHYKRAEELLEIVDVEKHRYKGNFTPYVRAEVEELLAKAQVHATLATTHFTHEEVRTQ